MPCPEKFKESLNIYKIDSKIINEINEGYENLVSSSPKKEKAKYFRRAMNIFDRSVDCKIVTELMDYNGCCKTGAREKNLKAFAKENKDKTLEEKIALIKNVRNMGTPKLLEDGTIYILAVQYYDGKKYRCACPNFNSSLEFLDTSKTYCKCCAGHFKHHYQIMLSLELRLVEVASSPLGSDGAFPCAFIFEIIK